MRKKTANPTVVSQNDHDGEYRSFLTDIASLLEMARRTAARSVNTVMTATYWEIGRRIVEFEQGGQRRAGYGQELLGRLAADLVKRYGRGFSRPNLHRFRSFYLAFPPARIRSTLSNKSPLLASAEFRSTMSNDSATQVPVSLTELARASLIFTATWGFFR